MNKSWISLVGIILICCVSLPAWGQNIETFLLSDLNPATDRRSDAVVGADGDIWFTVNDPERLIRIHDSEMECVYDSGFSIGSAYDVSISPEGQLYYHNLRYIYSPEHGIVPSGVIQPPYDYYTHTRVEGFDADMRMYCTERGGFIYRMGCLWEMFVGQEAILRYSSDVVPSHLIVSLNESWWVSKGLLWKRDLETGDGTWFSQGSRYSLGLYAKDCLGRLWLSTDDIVIFDGEDFDTFMPVIEDPGGERFYTHGHLVLTADFTV